MIAIVLEALLGLVALWLAVVCFAYLLAGISWLLGMVLVVPASKLQRR